MSLMKTITIPGIGELPDCYFTLGSVTFNVLEGSLKFSLVGWRDEATCENFMFAQDGAKAALVDAEKAAAALSALIPPDGATKSQIAKLEAGSVIPRAALVQKQAAFNTAQAELAQHHRLPVTADFVVPTSVVASLLTGDMPDTKKLIAWAKTQPDWQDAKDAKDA